MNFNTDTMRQLSLSRIVFLLLSLSIVALWQQFSLTLTLINVSDNTRNTRERIGATLEGVVLEVDQAEINLLCNETNEIVKQVYSQALLNNTEAKLWSQYLPFRYLNCEQLQRSMPTTSVRVNVNEMKDELKKTVNFDPNLAMQRLSQKLQIFRSQKSLLKIVVIGGSMSRGFVDYSKVETWPRNKLLAWPAKLQQFMQQKFGLDVEIVNLSMGGANENTWLGHLDYIMEHAPFDIILVESAVNDSCDYKDQISRAAMVNSTSHLLLNLLTNFPTSPAVISIELFRTAFQNQTIANRHCKGHAHNVTDPLFKKMCLYCPQWWMPQDWRQSARESNYASYVSYRDAVWPQQHNPPNDLCQFWSGLMHPQAGVHAMVASAIFFQFLVAMHEERTLVGMLQSNKNKVPLLSIPEGICVNTISSIRAVQGDPTDAMNLSNNENSCWEFRADSRRKYGWICEISRDSVSKKIAASSQEGNSHTYNTSIAGSEYFHLQKTILIGGTKNVILSRLVSFDERMATAQVWFSSSNSINSNKTSTTTTSENIFVGDPVWNVTSWHKDTTSIPQPYRIGLNRLVFKNLSNIEWPSPFSSADKGRDFSEPVAISGKSVNLTEVTFNLRLLPRSSIASTRNEIEGVDKFKLLGIMTC